MKRRTYNLIAGPGFELVRGISFQTEGELEKAEGVFRELHESYPGLYHSGLRLFFVLLDGDKLEAATAQSESMKKTEPDSPYQDLMAICLLVQEK